MASIGAVVKPLSSEPQEMNSLFLDDEPIDNR